MDVIQSKKGGSTTAEGDAGLWSHPPIQQPMLQLSGIGAQKEWYTQVLC